ncbi:Ig-like domain-containing protein [Candidatus Parabeggiatoa sp. HSG14]|uniref:Ig-like domain-containing protein n=1 Tax=Candidatus Parabeggiatoa sp. HSG14 TaxID=3055593 RepID=UPI0025A89A30|nr:Ig-like domain-containing protein [Thiotrichales bacterium HSG14]
MLSRFFVYLFTLIWMATLLTGCLGGGGSDANNSESNVITEITDGRVSSVKIIVSDNFQFADGNSKITLTIIARDTNNIPLSNAEVNFFSLSDTAFFEALSGITEENGRFTTTVTNSLAETIEIKAAAGGVAATPVTITFIDSSIDPRVSKVNLVVTDSPQFANGRDKIKLTVVARDAANAPISGVKVNLVSESDFAFLEALSGTTEENGRFTTTVTNTEAETFQITPIVGGVAGEPKSVTFTLLVEEVLLSVPHQVLQVNDVSTITVTALKQKYNLEEVDKLNQVNYWIIIDRLLLEELFLQNVLLSNASVKIMTSGNAKLRKVFSNSKDCFVTNSQESVSDETLTQSLQLSTNEFGQACFTVTNNNAETVTVTITSGSITRTVQLFFGATLDLLPKSTNAIETATLTALLKDGYNAPIVDQEVTFQFIDKNHETLTPNKAMTQVDGTAEITVKDVENNGGEATIQAKSGTLSSNRAIVKFLTTFREENRFLEVKTTDTVLSILEKATIIARIVDKNGLPISGQQVKFSVMTTDEEMSDAQISSNSGMSDENGKVETMVSNTIAENVIVTVQADTAKQEIPLYFGANIRLTPIETEGIADGVTPVTLTAIVSDAQGVGIAGVPVDVRVTSGQALLDNFRPITDELGQTTIKITSKTLDNAVIEAQAGNLQKASATLTFSPSEPDTLILNPITVLLSFNSQDVPIKATVKDTQDNPVKDGTPVNFTTTIGIITKSELTTNGIAEAYFNPNMQAGSATITATSGQLADSITIKIQPGDAGTIEISKIEPAIIGITGSGVVQSATIDFLIKDKLGNPVSDDTPVDFSLGKTTLGGGETIMTQSESGKTANGKTKNGLVSVILNSGRVAGTIDVIATVKKTINTKETISTVARVTIVGGLPDADHLSLAAEFLNIAGGVTFGLEDEITAYVGDRFGNIVPDNTAVSFITEGGMIGTSIGGGAFTTTTKLGQATAILQSASPTTPFLGGVPTSRFSGYECSGEYTLHTSEPILLCSNPGLVTIVAFTTGSESFADLNGNGLYDFGEPFDDLSEPYIDGNDNGIFEGEELYIDVNGNGRFDKGNNQFDGPGGRFQNTTIWSSMQILFSSHTRSKYEEDGLKVTPLSFSISDDGSEIFTVENISDIYGNALAGGTRLEVTTNNGVLGGTTDLTLRDSNGLGMQPIQFTLSSNPCNIDTDDEGKQIIECPLPSSATITVRVISPFQDKDSGGNGNEELIVSGTINVK